MKLFLLIANDGGYPSSGTDDWKGCFSTYDEAMATITIVNKNGYNYYQVGNKIYDWYEIVDLNDWINGSAKG